MHPDRPYRWGTWISVGAISGQLLGMLWSPIEVPDLRNVNLASFIGDVALEVADPPRRVEVAQPPVDPDAGAAPDPPPRPMGPSSPEPAGDGAPAGPSGALEPSGGVDELEELDVVDAPDGPGRDASSVTAHQPGPDDRIDGGSGAGSTVPSRRSPDEPAAGRSTTAPASPGSTAATSTTATTARQPGSTTTTPAGTVPDEEDWLDPVARVEACAVAPDTVEEWIVTLTPSTPELAELRIAVVALAAGLDVERFEQLSASSWRTTAAAGRMCDSAKLVEVAVVVRAS